MHVVCFHGRREIGGEGLFLSAARIFGEAAAREGFSAQVRTPGFPSPAGSPDRAVVKISREQFTDLAIPAAYDLEIVCDPLLAVVPPMGNALKPGGILVLNTQNAKENHEIRIASVDIDAIASNTPQRQRRRIWVRPWPPGMRWKEAFPPKKSSRRIAKFWAKLCARRKRRPWPRPPRRRKLR